MAARGERRPSFDEEEDDEPERYPAASKRDESDDSCSWTVVRTASFGATLIFFVLLAVWNPGNGTHHGHKHRRNRPKPKPLWPPAGQEVQGCNPVGNASTGLPVNRIARVFLLQRDERKNLADMINYHRQGLSPDQIVVLDHRSDDALTRRVLTRFSAAGGHVWRCERDFAHHRADMMSSVMRLYAPFSTYLIPLDADEMLAVSAKGSLTWGAAELNTALAALPEAAKMFKVRTTAGMPHDCPDMPHGEGEAEGRAEGLVAEKCLGAARPLDAVSCSSRTFYRGAAFAATDERHAVGATTARPDPTANAAACLSDGGLELLYHASSLAIIHFQVGSLNDLVMRVMRQAARLSPSRCNQKDRPHVSSEVKELQMYCQWHAALSKAELNLTAIRPAYEHAYCAPAAGLLSLQAALKQACFPASSERSISATPGM